MTYKDMFTVLIVDSRIDRSQSLRDAGRRIVGHLREDHHLHTDILGTTKDAIIRLRNDAPVACLLLEWGGTTAALTRSASWTLSMTSGWRSRCSCLRRPRIWPANRQGYWSTWCAA